MPNAFLRNALFWSGCIRGEYLAEIKLLREHALTRVLQAFADETIDREARAAKEQAWERLCHAAGEDSDPTDLAEQARDAGDDRLLMLRSLRQALLNLFAVALHHLVEQQQLSLLRLAMLPPREANKHDLLKKGTEEFKNRSRNSAVDVTTLSGWADLEELRVVANAVKHAEGPAAKRLRSRRPDLFVSPALRRTHPEPWPQPSSLYKPLFGEDLYVLSSDLECYFQAALQFWSSYAESLERHSKRS
ncbi:MAG: hypothetical protein ACHQ7N_06510 [Candidatus Methylomirabilales bacterium]